MTHKLFNVPPGTPFLHTLARAVLNGSLPETGGHSPSQLELSAYTILLPTRRAARALQEAFLAAAGGKAMLLPQIRPIAEGREDLSLIAALSGPAIFGPGAADVPPAVSEIERRLVLTSFVQHWSALMHKQAAMADVTSEQAIVLTAGAGTTAHASALAAELARLMDEIETEELSLAPLADIVPDQFSEHWSKTLEFLRIALESWPEYLKQHGLLSPMERRNRLIRAEAARLSARPPSTPVIVAGVTGSIPATAELMRVVAGLENGAVVLPGLDTGLDRESRDAIAPAHPEHPQFGLERLLAELRLATGSDTVTVLTGAEPAPDIAGRNRLISEAMRPAATSERWHVYAETADRQAVATALDGVTLIEAPTAEDEAETIALILREAVETPGQTAALVSRDRLLARRVAVRLESWGIRIDDSAGRPLAKTMPGAFLDLVIETIASGFWPATTMALLKHPLARLGLPAAQVRRAARALEIAIFRTLYIGRGIEGIIAALDRAEIDVKARERRGRAVQRLWDEDWAGARDLVDRLQSATAPLRTLFEMPSALELRDLARAHIATAEAAARLPEGDNARGLWAGEAGETASLFMTGLIEEGLPSLSVKADEYPDLYRSLVQGEIVRPKVLLHPRLSIWGPLEARLQQPDIVVIGGLNEGTWPEQVDPGPWLSRPMRDALGLPSPEARIGYGTHDFTMLMGTRTVYLTRAMKAAGAPTVPSRWLLRLRAVLAALGLERELEAQQPWLQWAAWRNRMPATSARIHPPQPRPPVGMRPRRLSVSAVETWMANPYAIFAREILKLEPLPGLGDEPTAALRGSVIHAALSGFAKQFPGTLPDEIARALVTIAMNGLNAVGDNPRVAAFWLPRFERFAEWFAATEPERRAGVILTRTEVSGALVLKAPAGPFTLTARADRIDLRHDGAVITDYKTTSNLANLKSRAASGEAPQLALEAAIALAGGFAEVAAPRIAALRYISASGGEPPGDCVDLKSDDLEALAREARAGLESLIARFDDPNTGYRALRRARFDYTYDEYAHLARVDEWAGADADGEEGASP